ncbi:hypothetical protein [Microbacterium sp.]|uniref:hypothetical protein n=1 Tax=Microbacterium sp. TaxID=51671 RepID=UPI0039E27C61
MTIGTFGEIGHLVSPNGRVVARARYRNWDGKTRLVLDTGNTRKSAERALKAKLADRTLFQPSSSALTPDSPFPDVVAYWLEGLELEDRLSKTTLQFYERNMRTLALPAFEHLTLREIGVARCGHFLKRLAKQSSIRAKQACDSHSASQPGIRYRHAIRWTLSPACGDRRRRRTRGCLRRWPRSGPPVFSGAGRLPSAPKPDGQLEAIVEVMLGTSARIGEVLAIRRRDIDVTSPVSSIRINGTIVTHGGQRAPPAPPYA